jgi:hypothetical protein
VLGALETGLRTIVITPRESRMQALRERVLIWGPEQISVPGSLSELRKCDLVVIDDLELVAGDLNLATFLADPAAPVLYVGLDWDACSMPSGAVRGVIKRARQKLLLCPPDHLVAQSLGVRMKRGDSFSEPAGRGILSVHGEQITVQVAR